MTVRSAPGNTSPAGPADFECRGAAAAFDGNACANGETAQVVSLALVSNPTFPSPKNGVGIGIGGLPVPGSSAAPAGLGRGKTLDRFGFKHYGTCTWTKGAVCRETGGGAGSCRNKESFMRRFASVAVLMVLLLAAQCLAQPVGSLEDLRDKGNITEADRQRIRGWIEAAVKTMLTSTDPSRRGMVVARDSIIYEVTGGSRTPAFVDAFNEEAMAALTAAEKNAISQEARVNFLMIVAQLRTLAGVAILRTALEKDPYPASRYWAAKGLALVAPVIRERVAPRLEAEISETIEKVLDRETSKVTLLQLMDALGQFDHERAHDVFGPAIGKIATRMSASDPVVAQLLGGGVRSLEKAYAREVRPEGKKTLLMAYATLCVWIIPPVADANLMADLNASLEKITGQKVAFVATDDDVMQKLALLEWVEKLLKAKQIPRRPSMPPGIEATVKELVAAGASSGAGGGDVP